MHTHSLEAELARLKAENTQLRAQNAGLQTAYDLEITRPGRFPTCDCNDDDCVACAHYPALVEAAKQRLAARTPPKHG